METLPKNGTHDSFTDNPRLLKDAVRDFEREYILDALKSFGNDKRRAALNLGISLSSFYRKIAEQGIVDEIEQAAGPRTN
ncbi:MAG TPA: helix-turn-helix domain-containing protein [Bacteroidota bacterium]|nr:helix-turn-helix domain-containing protein [Bacteroidota bacterium]